ncbi:MAG: hypothetical protein ACOYVF_02190 [Candidatus Zixiibacteriota bacterium]
MKTRISLSVLALGMFTLALLAAGCSTENGQSKSSLVKEVADSIGSTFVQSVLETALVQNAALVDSIPDDTNRKIGEIADMLIIEPYMYAVFDGGVIVYDFLNKSQEIIRSEDKLAAIARHDEQIYVGGGSLYKLSEGKLEKVADTFAGAISDLFSYDHRLMVGTSNGLYSTGIFGKELLFDDIAVTTMAADDNGLWVGTDGQGLYRWDGEEFRKRFLERDTALFDNVNTLAYNHQHLYIGSVNGLHIFDGGGWENLSIEDGLPSDNVRSIDASGWVILIATDAGVTSYFNGDFMPVKKLDDKEVSVIRYRKNRIVAASTSEGILYKSGNLLTTIVEPSVAKDATFTSLAQ